MSNSRKKTIAASPVGGQTKILFSEHPGKVAVLISEGKTTAMTFPGSHAALDWCEAHQATFYYLPVAEPHKN